ncbi:MAG: UDP-2,3-diacylglucosamine diphosphatase LpxI [Vampirovibrionales bacterium]|nr:UDP-2,3-diacylglucosamine diphosphatase LpxI [Vampirovibrionales bacterium]
MPRYQHPFENKPQKQKQKTSTPSAASLLSTATGEQSGGRQARHWGDWQKPKRMGIIAGEGELPVVAAKNAIAAGIEVIPFTIDKNNASALEHACGKKTVTMIPGMLSQNLAHLQAAEVSHLVFAGKVNKWILLRDPRMDTLAIEAFRSVLRKTDDDVMLWLVSQLRDKGFEILPQSLFLTDLFAEEACLTKIAPQGQALADIAYGFSIAREMGRLDVGQTVVIKDGMLIAVEAIEGTDACLKRSGLLISGQSRLPLPGLFKWKKSRGGVVVKVAKPDQDQRFDVPTVGLRTLQTMRQAGLDTLATEANETLFLEKEAMIAYANRHKMVIVSVSHPGSEK